MKKQERSLFQVNKNIDITIEDSGPRDPTGILNIRLLDKSNKPLQEISFLSDDVPELIRALTEAMIALEKKGNALMAYEAGYKDALEGRKAEFRIEYPDI